MDPNAKPKEVEESKPPVKKFKGREQKAPPEMTEEQLEQAFKLYATRSGFIAYSGKTEELQLPNGTMRLRRMPSGTTYVEKRAGLTGGITLEKMDAHWFAKMQKEIEEEELERANEKETISEKSSSPI